MQSVQNRCVVLLNCQGECEQSVHTFLTLPIGEATLKQMPFQLPFKMYILLIKTDCSIFKVGQICQTCQINVDFPFFIGPTELPFCICLLLVLHMFIFLFSPSEGRAGDWSREVSDFSWAVVSEMSFTTHSDKLLVSLGAHVRW